MKVFVNGIPVIVTPGMNVKHTLIQAGLLKQVDESKKVYDEWGNELGLDGVLSEGIKICIK